MLSNENIKIISYGLLISITTIFFIKHLADSGLIKISSGINLSLTPSKIDYNKAFLPLLIIPFMYLLNLKYKADIKKDKEHIRINSIITVIITVLFLLSYYFTRWKLINGPYNYSNYFKAPAKDFSPIFKSFSRMNSN